MPSDIGNLNIPQAKGRLLDSPKKEKLSTALSPRKLSKIISQEEHNSKIGFS